MLIRMSLNFTDLSWYTVLLRLCLTALCAATLGIDRTHKRHAAGFRTYVLVGIGACTAMMSGLYVFQQYGSGDPARIGSQVISGIGFLGAGTIILSGSFHVKGLTTAAGLWATAALGIAFGSGFYAGGILLSVIMLLVLTVLDRVQKTMERRSRYIDLFVILEDYYSMRAFFAEMDKRGWKTRSFSTRQEGRKGEVILVISVKMTGRRPHVSITGELNQFPGVILCEEVQE